MDFNKFSDAIQNIEQHLTQLKKLSQLSDLSQQQLTFALVQIEQNLEELQKFEEQMHLFKNREELLDIVVSNAPIVLYGLDKHGTFTLAVGKGLEAIGEEECDVVGHSIYERYRDYPKILEIIRKQLSGKAEDELWLSDLGFAIYENRTTVLRNNKGEVLGLIGVATDITERHQKELLLQNSLKEKEVLLQEVHHRVKNNLQIAYSLLDLQITSNKNPEVQECLMSSKNRIRIMAFVHEEIYREKNFEKINILNYLEGLTNYLFQIYTPNKLINLKLNIEKIHLDITTAICCGMIVNELLTNALKYAFSKKTEGTIHLLLSFDYGKDLHYCTLRVEDDGDGIPDEFELNSNNEQTQVLGLKLVKSLVSQLEGTLEITCNQGTKFRIVFPVSV